VKGGKAGVRSGVAAFQPPGTYRAAACRRKRSDEARESSTYRHLRNTGKGKQGATSRGVDFPNLLVRGARWCSVSSRFLGGRVHRKVILFLAKITKKKKGERRPNKKPRGRKVCASGVKRARGPQTLRHARSLASKLEASGQGKKKRKERRANRAHAGLYLLFEAGGTASRRVRLAYVPRDWMDSVLI